MLSLPLTKHYSDLLCDILLLLSQEDSYFVAMQRVLKKLLKAQTL